MEVFELRFRNYTYVLKVLFFFSFLLLLSWCCLLSSGADILCVAFFFYLKPVELKQPPVTLLCLVVCGLLKIQNLRISFRTSEIILIFFILNQSSGYLLLSLEIFLNS